MRLRQLFEAPSIAVMAFGRMNPPTIGHAKLVDAVKSQGGDPYIFLSQSQKPKTDPLNFEDKLRYAKFFFPNVTIGNPEVKTIIQALQKIEQLGYENLVYVAGSDRVESFKELINKYNGKDYTFKNITVVSAGERDPDADGAEGMSASKMRQAAADNDIESFRQGVPNKELADEMFAAVRKGMGISETVAENVPSNVAAPKTIKVMKPNAPKAPDATIPRSRDGYTTDDGTRYIQDKYNENIMHVSNGGGTFTFDDSRLIKWKTPKLSGLQYTYDYVQNKIYLDFTTTADTGDGDVGVNQRATYDMKGNLIQDSGEVGLSAGGTKVRVKPNGVEMSYYVSDSLQLRISKNKETLSPEAQQQVKALQSQIDGRNPEPLIKLANIAKQYGATVKWLNNGRAIPFNQGIELMRQAGG